MSLVDEAYVATFKHLKPLRKLPFTSQKACVIPPPFGNILLIQVEARHPKEYSNHKLEWNQKPHKPFSTQITLRDKSTSSTKGKESRETFLPKIRIYDSGRGVKHLSISGSTERKRRASTEESSSMHVSPWDDKPYRVLPSGEIAYYDERDMVSFLDPPKQLIPLYPSSYNPATYL
ncbi:unnamed protein product [Lactuca saligna]|nr:unnamed protein product [Lactuca saligna]